MAPPDGRRQQPGRNRAAARVVTSARSEANEMLHTEMGQVRRQERLETQQEMLLRFIRARFPEAPEEVAERVGRLRSQTALDRLIDRVAVANSLEEIERLLDA